MTEQYRQESINEQSNPSTLEVMSRDERQVEGLVPTGTTATIQRVKIPGTLALTQLSWAGILGPGATETVELRLFRIRPASNPSGFGFIQLNSTFVINTTTFTDAGGNIDISSTILPGLCVLPGEYVACSWVQAGPQTMQPLNMNWNFRPVAGEAEEPPATTTDPVDVFGP